nr:B3 domain-containing transcription factor VRN1-like [Coffea arabica]
MATNQRGNNRSLDQALNHQAKKPPHFFKVVLSPMDRGIKIPTAFMRDYGESLEQVVVLKVPTGASWPIELLQTEFGTWLDKGWKDFAEYYSIRECHFLVFEYCGDSQFQVIIFDPSASEIEYRLEAPEDHGMHDHKNQPPMRRRRTMFQKSDEVESDDDSFEILGEVSAAASCHTKQRRKSAQIHEEQDSESRKNENVEKLEVDVNPPQKMIKKESSEGVPSTRQSAIAKSETVIDKEKFISYQRAKTFTSENPFFISFMQPSYVTYSCKLFFSPVFAKKYLKECKHWDMELRVSEGTKIWPVTCYIYTTKAKIKRGWEEFVLDNNLMVGDVCVFELMKDNRMFNVTIYRRN